jgi:hypothetical protein
MKEDTLSHEQQCNAVRALGGLVSQCRDVYVRAATLLDIHSEEVARLRTLGVVERIDVRLLLHAYDSLCVRYRETLYDGQLALFAGDQKTPEEAWWAWFYHELTPKLLGSPHFVRMVLMTLGLLRCTNPSETQIALEAYLQNIEIERSYYHPTWPAPL